jgi:hypothetical protein
MSPARNCGFYLSAESSKQGDPRNAAISACPMIPLMSTMGDVLPGLTIDRPAGLIYDIRRGRLRH